MYFKNVAKILSKKIERQLDNDTAAKLDGQKESRLDSMKSELLFDNQINSRAIQDKVARFLREKISLWNKICSGSHSLHELHKKCCEFSKKGLDLQREIEIYELEQAKLKNLNVVVMKLRSIKDCLVNNQLQIAQKTELELAEMIKRDDLRPKDTLNNRTFTDGLICSFIVSIAQNLGRIKSKKSSEMATYFGYELEEFEPVNSISQLMPPFFAANHDQLVHDLIQRGTSTNISDIFQVFLYNRRQFIEPCNLYLNHFFFYDDDFCLNSSFLKTNSYSEYLIFSTSTFVCGVTERLFRDVFRTPKQLPSQLQMTKRASHPEFTHKISHPSDLYQNYHLFLFFPDLADLIEICQKDISIAVRDQHRLSSLLGKIDP